MTMEGLLSVVQEAFLIALMVAGPPLAAGLVTGVAVSMVQAVTQINEMTLAFIPKIVAILTVLLVSLPWSLQHLVSFTRRLMESMAFHPGG